ncbi:MAG: penicillin-binding transpeptidase domain-containing protein [bacterium]|nr:penicillin-binding transpeptidase domain-containing protein [bacterium]
MEENDVDPIRWKAGVLILLFASAFMLVLGRLFWVQVVDSSKYRELAKKQYESKVALRAERGKIFDRNMRDVANTIRTTSFAADPTMIERIGFLGALLSVADGKPAASYAEKIKASTGRFVWLARGVNTVLYPMLDTIHDKGLIRLKEPKRNFVYGPIASQVIGTTDVDNNGLTGLELHYDGILRGRSGFVVMQRDGRGRLRPSVNPEREAPENGRGLQLTLDIEMQRVAEQELARGVRESGAVSGTIVAIEPSTGDILAMASFPTFDPNKLDVASNDAIRIRAITDQYEPGSTLKLVTAAALLEEQKLAPNERVDGGNGTLQLNGHVVRDDHPVGVTTFKGALEQSSNVVFAMSSRLLDDRVFYKYMRDFGFGIPTGIDLPGEVRGRLKRPNEFDATTKTFMAFGYEISATALQMVNAYAAIANKGILMQPRCVKAIMDLDGDVETEFKPQTIRRVVSEKTATLLTDMLVGVVENGTGKLAKIPGVRIAGKTGTAQQLENGSYSRKSYTASFVGFYPADNPRVAMIVMLDRPSTSIYGGSTAAPIFRRIVQKTMTMLALDDQVMKKIAASAEADSVVVPDIRGLDVLTADTVVRRLGLRMQDSLPDSAMIMRQEPLPGTRVERAATVHVELQTSPTRPDVVGLSLRRAITVLHSAGFEVRVKGTGRVTAQEWTGNTCTLIAQSR